MALRLASAAHHYAHTMWLFTHSDLKTIIVPSTIFGLANATAAHRFHITDVDSVTWAGVLKRAPLVLLWVWIHLLPLDINNQRDQASIEEDRINKPWRPLPQGRLSVRSAELNMIAYYVLAQLFSMYIGTGIAQGLILVLLGVWYNNLGGANANPFIRNVLNALGYLCFTSGALEVAIGHPILISLDGTSFSSPRFVCWFAIIGGIILTTIHGQDMYDQEGDSARGRKTVPLVVGDAAARWMIAGCISAWGVICPAFWDAVLATRGVCALLAGIVAVRSLAFRDVTSDKATFFVWNIWVTFVYVLPLM